ncbi:MAG: cell division protein FtsQ/DivIB [Vicinamibacterales bacterium]
MSQVAAPADRRFRRAHVKPARKRRWRSLVHRAVLVGLLLAGLGVVGYQGVEAVAHARVLQIQHLVVTGNDRVPAATVIDALEGLKGQNLMWVDLDGWRDRLLQSPWVREASLRRSLPSTVEVTVTERVPVLIARVDSRLFLVDEQGVVIDHYGPKHARFDLPIVDGLAVRPAEPGVQTDPVRAALASRVIASVRGSEELAGRVSQIDVHDAHNAHVRLDGDAAVLYLGEEQFRQRLESYLQLADTLRLSVPDIEYVDLRFGNRLFVGPTARGRRAEAPLPARRDLDADGKRRTVEVQGGGDR